jgi:hypothetical protein
MRFASGKGFFRSSPLQDRESGQALGELHAETSFFEDIVDPAQKRIGVYKDRLQVGLTRS